MTVIALTPIAENPVLDPSDVPTVAARELALALKLVANGLALPSAGVAEERIQAAEAAYWQISRRSRTRKTAVLLRLRSLIAAGQTRRVGNLLARNGEAALGRVLDAAAAMRLNARWGFNPMKLARAATDAVAPDRPVELAVAA
jgi:hypothetical protein